MPPRSSKRRGGSAKRGAPKRKREPLKAADEDSEQLVEESVAVKKEVDDAEEVTVEKVPETVESLETDREALVTKEEEEDEEEDPEEETVVEETKLVEVVAKEEIVERDGSNDVVNVEETEENELVGDAERDETEPEEDDEIEPEEDDDEIDPEEEDAEIEPEEDTVDDLREKMADIDNHVGKETGPKEDTIEDLGEKMTDIDNHLGEASDGIARDNGNSMDEEEKEVDESGSDPEDEEDSSLYQQAPLLADHKKPKELEIFVGGLDRMAVEEDLIKVFGGFGDIQAVRIVKHPVTQKSKGFAFIRYATPEQARKVLADLKDGTEVKGKRVGISLSQETDTLYMGNICKTWTREQVLERLKNLGVEQIEEIYLPDNPNKEGKSKGYALLEFSTHSDAMSAFQRLKKPDALFGRDRSAKVAFSQSIHPSEEALLQVKTVYLEGLAESWEEDKLKKLCEQYGEVEKVQLSRNFLSTRRKDFGFVSFVTRESAVACVEGINKAEIGEGDNKVKANLAKPQYKGRIGKKAAKGGYKVQMDGQKTVVEASKLKGNNISKRPQGKGKGVANKQNDRWNKSHYPGSSGKQNDKRKKSQNPGSNGKQNDKQNKSQNPGSSAGGHRDADAPYKLDRTNKQREKNYGDGKRGRRNVDSSYNGRPSKKQRGDSRSRLVSTFGNARTSSYTGNVRQHYDMIPAAHAVPHAHGYIASAPSYQGHAYGTISGSTIRYSDMEPHAGYVAPAVVKQGRDLHAYVLPRASGYEVQRSIGTSYVGAQAPPAPQNYYLHGHPNYPAHQSGGSNTGYVYPQSGAYSYQPPRY